MIRALFSTPIPAVQRTLESVATRFPKTEFGAAASKALDEFGPPSTRPGVPTERLVGDLGLFGLPDLLQQLSLQRLTGTLTLRDREAQTIGTICLLGGRMRSCLMGRLEGIEALYQFFENPVAGSFVFQGQRHQKVSDAPQTWDVMSLIFEGARRYDELQRARSVVPDSSFLAPTGNGSVPQPKGEGAMFNTRLWNRVSAGATVEQCEDDCQTDAYSVRMLLARWVEENILCVR